MGNLRAAAPWGLSWAFCDSTLPGRATPTTPVQTHMSAFFRAKPSALFVHVYADTSTLGNLCRRRTPVRRERRLLVHVLYLFACFMLLLRHLRTISLNRGCFDVLAMDGDNQAAYTASRAAHCAHAYPTFDTIQSKNETEMRRAGQSYTSLIVLSYAWCRIVVRKISVSSNTNRRKRPCVFYSRKITRSWGRT
jgi:hypothetical protein